MTLADFYQSTTKNFNVTITFNGDEPDITNDTVTLTLKEYKSGAIILTKDADVATYGADGIARFELSEANTTLEPNPYFYEITWEPVAGGKYVLESDKVTVLDSITA